jgi:hypothetical protein
MRGRRVRAWVGGGIVLGLGVILLLRAGLCACALVYLVRPRLLHEMGRVAGAEQAFFTQHGRYARTMGELGYRGDSSFVVQLGPTADSTLQLTGTSHRLPGYRCVLDGVPRQRFLGPARCTWGDPESVPTMIVLRPAAGDTWAEGETYTIRWRAGGITRVNIGLALGGKDKGHVALDIPASPDSLRWRVPLGFVSGFGLARSDAVRVRVENAQNPAQFADSPPFTVTGRPKRARRQ